jgi:hypothetical protein
MRSVALLRILLPALALGGASPPTQPVPAARFCPTSGRVQALSATTLRVDAPEMRGVVPGDRSASAELEVVYRGSSTQVAPLADGEMRRQVGLKLRAHATCNVVYVMWQVEPAPGVHVSVKYNPGQSTHAQCRDQGYLNLPPTAGAAPAPALRLGEHHVLRAEIDAGVLTVSADQQTVWRGRLPPQSFSFDGPVGVRSDNGVFDLALRTSGLLSPSATCATSPRRHQTEDSSRRVGYPAAP